MGRAAKDGGAVSMRSHRPISPVEWGYLAAATFRPPMVLQLVVAGTGRLDPDDWARASAVASAATPDARLVRRGRFWWDSGRPVPVRSLAAGEASADRLHRPLDPDNGPVAEILLVGGDPGEVILRVSHAVMDARGLLLWAGNVFRSLRGEPPAPATGVLTEYALLSQRGRPPRRAFTGLTFSSPLGTAPPPTGRFGWTRRTIPATYPGLVARLAAATAQRVARPTRVMVPVDLRRHVPDVRSTANLSLPIFLDVEPGETWQRLHRRLLLAMKRHEELALGPAERVVARLPQNLVRTGLHTLDRYSRRRDRYMCSTLISHLGRIDLDAFATPDFRATSVHQLATHAPFAPFSFVVSESSAGTEVVMSHAETQRTAAGAFFDVLLDGLAR